MSVNKVIILGRLGGDPDLKQTTTGTMVCKFSVATSEKYKDKQGNQNENTTWHRIVCWQKLAEICEKHLSKGSQVYVEGKIQNRSWDDKDGIKRYITEIVASKVQFVGSSPKKSSGFDHDSPENVEIDKQAYSENNFTADDIPF